MKQYEKRLNRILLVLICVYILMANIVIASFAYSYINAEQPSTSPTEPVGTTIMPECQAPMYDENPPLDNPERPTEPVETLPEIIPEETTEPIVETTPPETTIPETTAVTEPETEPETLYFDVPLSEDLQDHIFKLCEESGVEPDMVMAMIRAESTYNPNCIGDGGDSLGLLQIQPKWHQWRMDELDCPDLMDPYQNVTVAIDILTEFYETGKSDAWILMAYNGGEVYANRKASNGEISDYAVRVLEFRDELSRG